MRLRDLFFKKGADLSWSAAKAQVEARRAASAPAAGEAAPEGAKAQALATLCVSRVATAGEKRAAYLELAGLVGEREADRLVARERRTKTRAARA